jgi:hypothetical protein
MNYGFLGSIYLASISKNALEQIRNYLNAWFYEYIIHMTRIAITIKLYTNLFVETHIDHAQVTTLRHFDLLL